MKQIRCGSGIGMLVAVAVCVMSRGGPGESHPTAGVGRPLFSAWELTTRNAFTPGVEGPACDSEGNLYAVNFARQQTIGRIAPDGTATVWLELPGKSTGNGIRVDARGRMWIADYVGHHVIEVDIASRKLRFLAHNSRMNQPNDLTLAPNGTLYASDPDWKNGTGKLWKIDRSGETQCLAEDQGTTNGIEVSPDGRTLYVNESVQRRVWKWKIRRDGTLSNKKLIHQFSDHSMDGMRCDVDGNLYITRHGAGLVVKMSPNGEILREIPVIGSRPSNIAFGGPDGCTAYVTEVDVGGIVCFRVDRPGMEWRRSREKSP